MATTSIAHGETEWDAREERRRRVEWRHASSVSELMERRRGELEGVSPMADLIYEATRWAA